MTATVPRQIGDYQIEKELGRGAHGAVYRAHRRAAPEESIALKVVENRGSVDRLLLEPTLLSKLNHPCVVGLRDYFLAGDDLVLALELIDGEDLQSVLEGGRTFRPEEVRDLLVQLASALAHAHERNIIHRDVKPSNILVVGDGERERFVLTDFGIGRVSEGLQLEKHTGGTYLYMAPEQLRGRPGPPSDLWALGVIAYRLLSGRLPFPGPSLAELTQQICYASPPPPRHAAAGPLDPELDAVVMRLLDKSLQERFASAEEVLQALHYRGAPEAVLRRKGRRRAAAPGKTSLDRQLERSIALRWLGLAVGVLVFLATTDLLGGLLLMAAMVMFYHAYLRKSTARWVLLTLGTIPLLLLQRCLPFLFPSLTFSVFNLALWDWLSASLGFLAPTMLVLLSLLFWLVLPGLFAAAYASLRRLHRQRLIRQAALADDADSQEYLEVFRAMLDSRFEDVELHLRYAETLFNIGRIAQAAVEARLLLLQDPYHFNGNLLLASAYQRLGLERDCLEVCENYLAVSGYSFEFSELRELCRRRLAHA